MYRPPNGDTTVFEKFFENLLSANDKTSKNIFADDLNINVLDYESNKKVKHFTHVPMIPTMIPNMIPTTINKPTRKTRNTATVIDHIVTNTVINGIQHRSGIIKSDMSYLFPIAFALNSREKSKPEDMTQFICKPSTKKNK